MTIGQSIKSLRTKKKLTQKQLADRLAKIDRTKLCRVEQDKAELRLSELAEIAAALGVSPKRLMG